MDWKIEGDRPQRHLHQRCSKIAVKEISTPSFCGDIIGLAPGSNKGSLYTLLEQR